MTEEEARDYCETYMDSSSAFVACKGVPSVPTDASLEICQIDILVRSICYVNRVTLHTLIATICNGDLYLVVE